MALCDDLQRFNTIKRWLGGVSQKSLTETLRKLESSGLITRRVIPVSPVAVEYSLTTLGWTLQEPFTSLCGWALRHQADVESARKDFASRKAERGPTINLIRAGSHIMLTTGSPFSLCESATDLSNECFGLYWSVEIGIANTHRPIGSISD